MVTGQFGRLLLNLKLNDGNFLKIPNLYLSVRQPQQITECELVQSPDPNNNAILIHHISSEIEFQFLEGGKHITGPIP